MSTSNIHIRQREHQQEQRRIKAAMGNISAMNASDTRRRDDMAAQLRATEHQLTEISSGLYAAKNRKLQEVMEQQCRELRQQADQLRAGIEATERRMSEHQANHADWQSHLSLWDPQPVSCPQCGGDRVVSMNGRSGMCDDCDAHVPLGNRPILRNGRMLQQRHAA